MKKMIYKFRFFCKEEPLYVLSLFSTFLFMLLDCLLPNSGFYVLFLYSSFAYFYCLGRHDEKEKNKKCQ